MKTIICPRCEGPGWIKGKRCKVCEGHGELGVFENPVLQRLALAHNLECSIEHFAIVTASLKKGKRK